MLNPAINEGSLEGLLAAFSLSKRSNIAGYRAGFLAGDAALLGELLQVRKHSGLMMSGPVQDAMTTLLGDQAHVEEQRQRYLRRRDLLRPALEAAGFRVEHSEGSLYLWATLDENCRDTVDRLAASASSPRPATSTAKGARSTSAWRSPPPTSASPRRPSACGRPERPAGAQASSIPARWTPWWPRCPTSAA